MIVAPKVYATDEDRIQEVGYGPDHTLIVRCGALSPESAKGRNVELWIDADMGRKLLALLREQQIAVRRRPMSEGS